MNLCHAMRHERRVHTVRRCASSCQKRAAPQDLRFSLDQAVHGLPKSRFVIFGRILIRFHIYCQMEEQNRTLSKLPRHIYTYCTTMSRFANTPIALSDGRRPLRAALFLDHQNSRECTPAAHVLPSTPATLHPSPLMPAIPPLKDVFLPRFSGEPEYEVQGHCLDPRRPC